MGPEKAKKKGLWSPDEDQMLRDYVVKNGHASWTSIPIHAGLKRSGKSCRLRWINYLRPGLKRGDFSIAEVDTILTLHQILGNKWSQIALHLPGRSDNEIKNYWHSCLKKRVAETSRIEEIEGVEEWSSYIKSTPESCSSPESLEHGKGLVVERDECVQVQQRLSLPKVLFAEWLSFDEFNNHGLENNHTSNSLVDDLLKNGNGGGAFGVEKCSQDMLHSDCQLDYFPGINYDDF